MRTIDIIACIFILHKIAIVCVKELTVFKSRLIELIIIHTAVDWVWFTTITGVLHFTLYLKCLTNNNIIVTVCHNLGTYLL